MIPELKQSIDSKKYYRPPIIKLSKKTKRKVAHIELFILELFEKAYSFLTLSLIRKSIDNFLFIRRLHLAKFFEKPGNDETSSSGSGGGTGGGGSSSSSSSSSSSDHRRTS